MGIGLSFPEKRHDEKRIDAPYETWRYVRFYYLEPALLLDKLSCGFQRVKVKVRFIENASLSVGKIAEKKPKTDSPASHVRKRYYEDAAWRKIFPEPFYNRHGIFEMFKNAVKQYDIELSAERDFFAVLKVKKSCLIQVFSGCLHGIPVVIKPAYYVIFGLHVFAYYSGAAARIKHNGAVRHVPQHSLVYLVICRHAYRGA